MKENRLSPLKEIGVCIKAFIEAESGVRAVQPRMIRDAVRRQLPDPTYPTAVAQAAE
ncbi:MAG TPA: hypothetical protein VFE60_27775 [Roseiarcus sp.]|nr:hypothetical protein [Roseiarcus sp.]